MSRKNSIGWSGIVFIQLDFGQDPETSILFEDCTFRTLKSMRFSMHQALWPSKQTPSQVLRTEDRSIEPKEFNEDYADIDERRLPLISLTAPPPSFV